MGKSAGSPGWRALAALLALPAAVPLATVFLSAATPDPTVWSHLGRYVLPEVAANTVLLAVGVGALTLLIGVPLGWLTAVCEFPGRRFFSWALLLPLAMPGYVLGFVSIATLDYAGPVQTSLRNWFGAAITLPPIRSAGGAILVMSLCLYPYVYLLARGAFLTQGRRAIEAGRSLGLTPARAFVRLALPLARPWIAGGLALALMESLADFGTVAVFNFDTFTVAIYRAWYGFFAVEAALQLAAVLLIGVLLLLVFEQRLRSQARYGAASGGVQRTAPFVLNGRRAWVAFGCCAGVLVVAFILPCAMLVIWAVQRLATDLDPRYFGYVARSFGLAAGGAVLIALLAVLLAYAQRRAPAPFTRLCARVATCGYAVPGTVLAVGIMTPVVLLNNTVQSMLDGALGAAAPAVYLQGTLLALLSAYAIRFLAVAHAPVDGNLQRVTRGLDEAAATLGLRGLARLRRVHLPLLRTGLSTALALTFVDIMKEMPITLMTRPFGWDTLAVRVFEMTAEGHWDRAALPALAIVLVGLIPVAVLTRRGEHAA